MKAKELIPWFMVVIGIGGLIGGAYFAMERINFLNKAVQTRGIIVDIILDRTDGSSYGPSEFPIFQFVDLEGVEYNVRGNVGGVYSAFDIGKEVDIYYDPENPTIAVVSSFLDMWSISLVLLGFGLIFVFIGGLGILFTSRNANTRN